MVVILVHWMIKADRTLEFEAAWKGMTVSSDSGLYREILARTQPSVADPKFNTFIIGNPSHATYINIGMWESVEAFDAAIGKFIPTAQIVEKEGRTKFSIELEPFEFKLRERIVLSVVSDRGRELPPAEMSE